MEGFAPSPCSTVQYSTVQYSTIHTYGMFHTRSRGYYGQDEGTVQYCTVRTSTNGKKGQKNSRYSMHQDGLMCGVPNLHVF